MKTFQPWLLMAVLSAGTAAGCIGSRFDPQTPAAELDVPTRTLLDQLTTARTTRGLAAPTWVNELRPPTVRAALGVARGDISLKTAAYQAAMGAVTEIGRHVWTFATECTDLAAFQPPPLALQGRTLLLGGAVVTAPGGKSIVVLAIAEPGTSALRADQMGGGGGGTKPPLETYAHPLVASAPCGAGWPTAAGARF